LCAAPVSEGMNAFFDHDRRMCNVSWVRRNSNLEFADMNNQS
jgi:hypothetical protein